MEIDSNDDYQDLKVPSGIFHLLCLTELSRSNFSLKIGMDQDESVSRTNNSNHHTASSVNNDSSTNYDDPEKHSSRTTIMISDSLYFEPCFLSKHCSGRDQETSTVMMFDREVETIVDNESSATCDNQAQQSSIFTLISS